MLNNLTRPQYYKDYTHKRFGKLFVIERASIGKHALKMDVVAWLCHCQCGENILIEHNSMREATSCGCESLQYRSLSGQAFGKLTVLCRAINVNTIGKSAKTGNTELCLCACGVRKIIARKNLLSGGSLSCGCTRTKSKQKDL